VGENLQTYLDSLLEVSARLKAGHRELALLLEAEKRSRVEGWFACEDTRLQVKEHYADYTALNISRDVIKLKGDIAALVVEREDYLLLIDIERTK
jgi:hypothetical protein